MKVTPNYILPQLEGADFFDREALNDGFSKIDTAISDLQDTINGHEPTSIKYVKELGDKIIKSEEVLKKNEDMIKNGGIATKGEIAIINSSLENVIQKELPLKVDRTYVDNKTQANNLSYKESYNTLAMLQSAYPNGDTYNHVILADGMIYTYAKGVWTNTNIQANGTGIADVSITPKKLSFTALKALPSKNLFDKANVTPGYYIDYSSGIRAVSNAHSATDFIEIEPETQYILSGQNEQFAFYDSAKVYVSGLAVGTRGFSTPSNAKYIRLTIDNTKINVVQLEKGSVATSYTSGNPKIDVNDIEFASISTSKIDYLNSTDIKYVKSKNLFDKSTVTPGYYIDYTKGIISINASYSASDYIPVLPNTTYTKSNGEQFAFYNSNKVYISGSLDSRTFTTPSDCYYVRFSIPNTGLNSFQFELGSVATLYESYGLKIDSSSIKSVTNSLNKTVFIVDKNGNGDYKTITGAINDVKDSPTNHVSLLIYPGTYEESVYVGGGRYISLIGVNKNECIITDKTGLYANAPLEIQGVAYVANLTLYATFTDENVVISNKGSYAVHCDYRGEGTTEFFNCNFISDCSSALGAGLRNNQTLLFRDCNFKSTTKPNYNSAWSKAVFVHGSETSTDINQNVIFDDCTMKSAQGEVLRLANVGSVFNATFYNNMLWSGTLGKADTIVYDAEQPITITLDSYGNNVSKLNK